MSRVDAETVPAITFYGTSMSVYRSVKDLGLLLDCTLNWREQVMKKCQVSEPSSKFSTRKNQDYVYANPSIPLNRLG